MTERSKGKHQLQDSGEHGGARPVRKNEITTESLARVLVSNDLSEIEYEENGRRIYMSRHTSRYPIPATDISPIAPSEISNAPAHAEQVQEIDWHNHPDAVLSPMVGVAYMSPEPGAEPFVRVGSMVSPGQILLLVEAMKVLNPIKASKGGKVVKILANDQKPVEYNEPLMVIVE
jgi:acetyl-CoA carboxylase biotin carboxyl carrier protein